MRASDFEIRNHSKLDDILVRLCELVIDGQRRDPDFYSMVAAAVLDPDNNCVAALNYRVNNGKCVHGERAAIDAYRERFGEIPEGSIILTTCSPCSEFDDHTADGRVGSSCTDLIDSTAVHKVYAGYRDPSQDTRSDKRFHLQITKNKKIQELCKAFADTWLKDDLNELNFLGSPCTKDCSGHRAGYAWSQSKGGRVAQSPFSPSFNNGSQLHVDGK